MSLGGEKTLFELSYLIEARVDEDDRLAPPLVSFGKVAAALGVALRQVARPADVSILAILSRACYNRRLKTQG